MANIPHTLKKNQRVRLKTQGEDAPYALAVAGNEGWIRKLTHDSVGYPMVYIEWDKNHWAFNGEPDTWTFENHFEPVEEEVKGMGDDKKKDEDLAAALIDFLQNYRSNTEKAPEDLGDPSEHMNNRYSETLASAMAEAEDADAFLIIMVSRGSDGVSFDPKVFQYYKSNQSGLILETQLSRLGTFAHEQLAFHEIRRQQSDTDKGEA